MKHFGWALLLMLGCGGGGGGGGDDPVGPDTSYPGPNHPLSWDTTDPTELQNEIDVLTLINAHRTGMGLNALLMDPQQRLCARGHSKHMTQNCHDFFAHVNPEGDSPFDRMGKLGITYTTAGENIAAGYPDPPSVVTGWLNSPGHKANIETAAFGHTGVGYQPGTTNTYITYWTQTFTN